MGGNLNPKQKILNKSSLKVFFRPDRRKNLAFWLILLLTILLRGTATELGIKSLAIVEIILSPHYLLYGFIETWLLPFGLGYVGTTFGSVLYYLLIITTFVIGVIYWYFLACLLIFIYERLKEKIRKK